MKRSLKVSGGEKLLRNVKSYKAVGIIKRLSDGATGDYQFQSNQPQQVFYFFDLKGFETAFGFNGKSAWTRDSKNGLQTLNGIESRDFQALANYRNNLWLNYKKDKSRIVYSGQSEVDGKTADAVTLTNTKGVSIKLYFDSTTGLLAREVIPFGDSVSVYDYSDYRTVDGIQTPFFINAEIRGEKYEIRLSSVTRNSTLSAETFNFPQASNQPLPDISQLLKEVQTNEDRIEEFLEKYTYKQTNTTRTLEKDGILRAKESETFQLTFYKGNRIRRLIAKNSKPLSKAEQDDEDKNVAKRVAEIEKEISKKEARQVRQNAVGTPDEENRRISIAEVLRASKLSNPRRERFRHRDVIVFDFEPNPNFDFKNAKSFLKFFGKTAGVIWIDAADKQVARIEAVLFDNYKVGGGLVANLKKGAAFTLENNRINDEIWLPSSADINLSVKVLLIKGIDVNVNIKYSDYEKFNTEIKDSQINEAGKPD